MLTTGGGDLVAHIHDIDPQERHSSELAEADPAPAEAGEAGQIEPGPVPLDSGTVAAAREQHAAMHRQPSESVCVHYGGRQFITTYEMAGIFLRRSQRLIDAEDAELVPLVYEGGLELLYVSSAIPFSVHDAAAEPADGSHPQRSASGGRAAPHLGAHDSEVA